VQKRTLCQDFSLIPLLRGFQRVEHDSRNRKSCNDIFIFVGVNTGVPASYSNETVLRELDRQSDRQARECSGEPRENTRRYVERGVEYLTGLQ
jgi:hypothetical protein